MSDTYAWTYNAGNGVYYWTESFTMSATQFAREVSSKVDKSLSSSDVSAETKVGWMLLKGEPGNSFTFPNIVFGNSPP